MILIVLFAGSPSRSTPSISQFDTLYESDTDGIHTLYDTLHTSFCAFFSIRWWSCSGIDINMHIRISVRANDQRFRSLWVLCVKVYCKFVKKTSYCHCDRDQFVCALFRCENAFQSIWWMKRKKQFFPVLSEYSAQCFQLMQFIIDADQLMHFNRKLSLYSWFSRENDLYGNSIICVFEMIISIYIYFITLVQLNKLQSRNSLKLERKITIHFRA